MTAARSIIFTIGLLALATPGHAAPAELPGDYRPPPAGTTVEYDRWQARITHVGKDEFDYISLKSNRNFTYTAFFVANPKGSTRIKNRARLFCQLWPLKVGNKIKTEFTRDGRVWEISVEVTGKEVITVPYGAFFRGLLVYIYERLYCTIYESLESIQKVSLFVILLLTR